MTAQSAGQVLLAGGSLATSGKKTKLCKAFKAAAKKFCAPGCKSRFNDLFYKELKDTSKYGDLAKDITREVPALMSKGQVAAQAFAKGGAVAMTVADSGAANLMSRMIGAMGSPISGAANVAAGAADAQAWGMIVSFFQAGGRGSGYYMRFLDGQFSDGTVLELKGPGDKFHGSQGKDLKKLNGGKDPIVVSCESCKANCKNNGGGRKRGCP